MERIAKTLVVLLTCICVLPVRGVAQDSLSLTLDRVIELALKENIEVSSSALRAESSEFALKEAASNSLPKVTLNGSYNRNIDKQVIFLPEGFGGGGPTRIGLNNNFTTSIDLNVPIYSKTYQANRIYADRNRDLVNESYRGIRQSVVNNVKKLYFQRLAAVEVIKVRRKALANALENSSNIENKLINGLATEFDQQSARVKVKVAQNNLLDAEKQSELASNNLKVVMGIDVKTILHLADSLALSSEELLTEDVRGLAHNSDLRQSALQQRLAQQQVDVTKSAYFPTLSLVGSYQYQSQQDDFNFNDYRWVKTSYVGLKFQLPIFNGMVTRNKIQQAIFSQRIAGLQNEYTARNLESQMKQVMIDLQYSREKLELQKENVSVSETALALTKERYNFGKGTFIEVSNAELDLVSAQLNYLQAVLEYKSAFYDYQLLTGTEN